MPVEPALVSSDFSVVCFLLIFTRSSWYWASVSVPVSEIVRNSVSPA